MASTGLFDLEPRARRHLAGNLPVPFDRAACPACGAGTVTVGMVEQALFRHGGYGADRVTARRLCRAVCGWALTTEVGEANPRHARTPA